MSSFHEFIIFFVGSYFRVNIPVAVDIDIFNCVSVKQAARFIASSERLLDVSDCVFLLTLHRLSSLWGGLSSMAWGKKSPGVFLLFQLLVWHPWHSRCPGVKVKSWRLRGAFLVSQVSTSRRHPRHWKGVEESVSLHIRPQRVPRAKHAIQGERGKDWKTNMRYKFE